MIVSCFRERLGRIMSKYPVRSQVGEYTPLHLAAGLTTPFLSGVGKCIAISQTLGSTINLGVNTVAVSSVKGMYQGQVLNFVQSGGTPAEDVRVLQIDPVAKTFTALFVNSYTSGVSVNITSRNGSYCGALLINQPGTGISITLSNGHPNLAPTPTDPRFGIFAVVQPTAVGELWYQAECDFGLFVQVMGTTVGDYSLMHRDQVV